MRKLYDFFIETFYMPWGDYLRQYKSCGQKVEDTFQSDVYFSATLELFGITILLLIIYYLVLNNRFGRYYSNRSWGVAIISNAVIISIATYFSAYSSLGNPSCNISSLVRTITFSNLLLSIVLFFFLSFLFRRLSLMGKHTPYFTSN